MGSSPLIIKYPLDLTGINPNNLVTNEPHVLPDGVNRAIVPNYGAYYSNSLVVKDADTGIELVAGEQFKAVQLYQEATVKSGLEVTSVVVVVDPDVSSNITITYQAVGGEFSYSVIALRDMIASLDLDSRPVEWADVLGTPDLFPPAPHLHDAGDLYGFEYLVEAMDALRRAVLIGNEMAMDEVIKFVNEMNAKILPKASMEDAVAGIRDDVVLTPATAKLAFDYWAGLFLGDPYRSDMFGVHMATTDPHDVTSSQVGLGSLTDTQLATIEQSVAVAVAAIPPRQ